MLHLDKNELETESLDILKGSLESLKTLVEEEEAYRKENPVVYIPEIEALWMLINSAVPIAKGSSQDFPLLLTYELRLVVTISRIKDKVFEVSHHVVSTSKKAIEIVLDELFLALKIRHPEYTSIEYELTPMETVENLKENIKLLEKAIKERS